MVAGRPAKVRPAMGDLRLQLGDKFGLRGGEELRFLWVVEFPLFEHSEQEGRLVSVNHPFTAPNPDDLGFLAADPLKARALAYDVVLNGEEMGGGSIRIHNPELQMRVFELLGFSREEASEKFGFLLEALSYGAPPHGGIALGRRPAHHDAVPHRFAARRDGVSQDPARGRLDDRGSFRGRSAPAP